MKCNKTPDTQSRPSNTRETAPTSTRFFKFSANKTTTVFEFEMKLVLRPCPIFCTTSVFSSVVFSVARGTVGRFTRTVRRLAPNAFCFPILIVKRHLRPPALHIPRTHTVRAVSGRCPPIWGSDETTPWPPLSRTWHVPAPFPSRRRRRPATGRALRRTFSAARPRSTRDDKGKNSTNTSPLK